MNTVLICCCEQRPDLESLSVNLPENQHSQPQLFAKTLDSNKKNEIAHTSGGNEFSAYDVLDQPERWCEWLRDATPPHEKDPGCLLDASKVK